MLLYFATLPIWNYNVYEQFHNQIFTGSFFETEFSKWILTNSDLFVPRMLPFSIPDCFWTQLTMDDPKLFKEISFLPAACCHTNCWGLFWLNVVYNSVGSKSAKDGERPGMVLKTMKTPKRPPTIIRWKIDAMSNAELANTNMSSLELSSQAVTQLVGVLFC